MRIVLLKAPPKNVQIARSALQNGAAGFNPGRVGF
jgi:hypothetical protein